MKKIFLVIALSLVSIFSAFSQSQWYICMGSFSVEKNAKVRSQELEKDGLKTFIAKCDLSSKKTYYRVFYETAFDKRESAVFFKNLLTKSESAQKLKIKDLWVTQYPETEESIAELKAQEKSKKKNKTTAKKTEEPRFPVINPEEAKIEIIDGHEIKILTTVIPVEEKK